MMRLFGFGVVFGFLVLMNNSFAVANSCGSVMGGMASWNLSAESLWQGRHHSSEFQSEWLRLIRAKRVLKDHSNVDSFHNFNSIFEALVSERHLLSYRDLHFLIALLSLEVENELRELFPNDPNYSSLGRKIIAYNQNRITFEELHSAQGYVREKEKDLRAILADIGDLAEVRKDTKTNILPEVAAILGVLSSLGYDQSYQVNLARLFDMNRAVVQIKMTKASDIRCTLMDSDFGCAEMQAGFPCKSESSAGDRAAGPQSFSLGISRPDHICKSVAEARATQIQANYDLLISKIDTWLEEASRLQASPR